MCIKNVKNSSFLNLKKEIIYKISTTILRNYSGRIIAIIINSPNYELDKGEECIIDYNHCTLISQNQWEAIIKENIPKKIKKKYYEKKRKYSRKKSNDKDS